SISHHRSIVCDPKERRRSIRDDANRRASTLKASLKKDGKLPAGPGDFPRVWLTQPVIWLFDLVPIADRLAEHAVVVAEAVSHRRILKRRERIDKARREPSESAIAQPRIGLFLENLRQIPTLALQGALDNWLRRQVDDVVVQRTANQELHRQVVHAL